MLRYITTIGCCAIFATFTAAAGCDLRTPLGVVSFDNNSSYFDKTGARTLDEMLDNYHRGLDDQDGYLLMEFGFNRNQGDKKLQSYNMWLAQRRIDRVKTYLNKGGFGANTVSRILTAAATENRQLSLSWCPLADAAHSAPQGDGLD